MMSGNSAKEVAKIIDNLVKGSIDKLQNRTFKRGVIGDSADIDGQYCSVYIEGNTTATEKVLSIAGYKPQEGDKVILLSIGETGANLLILGKLDAESNEYIEPTLAGSWVVYDNVYSTPGYLKTSDGFVHLKGMVKSGSGTIFTLPEGHRPLRRMLFVAMSASALGRIDIEADGQVRMQTGGSAWISLDHISFKAEQ